MKGKENTVEQFYVAQAPSLGLGLMAGAQGLKRPILEPTVNRPGLALAGFTKYFASKRIQAIGSAEVTYLKTLTAKVRTQRYEALCEHPVPCFVFSRNLKPDRDFLRIAERANIPVFRCPLITMQFISRATLALEDTFAPRTTVHGSMVDILGIGVIIKGESGIGKSECVLSLLERGYSLVADDVTRLRLLDGREVMGTSADITRNHMEVRGIGIIDVAAMFGVKSIRTEKRVDLVVTLREWDKVGHIDRIGLEEEKVDLLGIDITHVTIPVRPGRDLASLVEAAALNTKLRQAGFNAAAELNRRLLERMEGQKAGQ
ncbi:MAG: HPr(Ser) kinase/phosphatase [Pedosphaera sp.]|nr:HPr(Ser) kinase/phosphatase [Pedosphaera sp.]MSU44508.1 HPr(Ser) kinase/phosphatase [Pedosphaera sp.]